MGEMLSNNCVLVTDTEKDFVEGELISPQRGGTDAPAV